MKRLIRCAEDNLKSYDVQDKQTGEWSTVKAKGPRQAAEQVAGRPVSTVAIGDDYRYYVFQTGSQSDKWKMYYGRYGRVSRYL